MAAEEEDFSFPTTTDTPPRFIGSPRLWRTASLASSSSSSPSHHHSAVASSSNRRKSFSEVGCKEEEGCSTEEKMDALWENFNEEFSRNLTSSVNNSDHRNLSRFGCVGGSLKLSMVSSRRRPPSFVVLVKVLKKMLMLHNSHRTSQ